MSNIRFAFFVPFICHVYVLYFAVRGYRPEPELGGQLRSIPVQN